MWIERMWWGAAMAAALAGCGMESDEGRGKVVAHVGSTGTIPVDGRCTHITSTRLSDFAVSEYRGPLAGASFSVDPGEAHVTATAYAEPCSQEPDEAPWVAEEQITTFAGGANVLVLSFHASGTVTIDPIFDADRTIAVRPGTAARLGRNGEDAAGPGFSLNGWDVTELALPPAAPSETFRFSLRGKGGLPYAPRGLARLPDGRFVAQLFETFEPLRTFSQDGDFLESWPVVYPAGTIRWDGTDGLEAVDATHLVRTVWLNVPIDCDEDGAGCIQAGIEVLELQADTNGNPVLVATEQIPLPEPYNQVYPVGVAKVGASYAVAMLPDATELILLAPDGTIAAGPTVDPGSMEGLFATVDGRLGALDYRGALRMYNAGDLSPRPGETAALDDGVGFGYPRALAWNGTTGTYLALSGFKRLVSATPDFGAITDLAIDLSGYLNPSGMDHRPEANQVAIADRLPPIDPVTGTRIPRVDFHDLATSALASSTLLTGLPANLRLFSLAYVPGRQQIVSHYRRPGSPPDPIDTIVYTHQLDGSIASTFDLRPLGIRRIATVNYLPATDELLCTVVDLTGQVRLVVTSPTGQPRRSYRADSIAGVIDVAPITSGPHMGDLGVVFAEPSEYVRAVLE